MMPIGILGAGSAEGGIGVAGGAGAAGGIGILGPAAGLATLDNYIEDDWDDNALTGRTGQTRDAFLEPASDHAGRVLAGIYRPDWTTESGSPSATNQELQLADGSTTAQTVKTNSSFTVGFWEYDYQFASDPTTGAFNFSFFHSSFAFVNNVLCNDGYEITKQNNGDLQLREASAGSFTTLIDDTGSPDDTTLHTVKVTRDPFGGFEMFEDTVSSGTATDTTHTEAVLISIGNDTNVRTDIDNLVIS